MNERTEIVNIVAEGRVVRYRRATPYRRVRFSVRVTRRQPSPLIPALLILATTIVLLALIVVQPGAEVSRTVGAVLATLILALTGGARYVARAVGAMR